jgi:hypothetical protein
MKITVHRQACCSQDDQCGPLEAEYVIEADATFSSLIEIIIKSGFLQFSSTHNRISGEADNKRLVEIFLRILLRMVLTQGNLRQSNLSSM